MKLFQGLKIKTEMRFFLEKDFHSSMYLFVYSSSFPDLMEGHNIIREWEEREREKAVVVVFKIASLLRTFIPVVILTFPASVVMTYTLQIQCYCDNLSKYIMLRLT